MAPEPICTECNDTGYIPVSQQNYRRPEPLVHWKGRPVIICNCEQGDHFAAMTLADACDEAGSDVRHWPR